MSETREEMIEFIATVDEKPVSHVETILKDMSVNQIKPLYDRMKITRNEMLRDRVLIMG